MVINGDDVSDADGDMLDYTDGDGDEDDGGDEDGHQDGYGDGDSDEDGDEYGDGDGGGNDDEDGGEDEDGDGDEVEDCPISSLPVNPSVNSTNISNIGLGIYPPHFNKCHRILVDQQNLGNKRRNTQKVSRNTLSLFDL